MGRNVGAGDGGGVDHWYMKDHLGSVRTIVKNDGNDNVEVVEANYYSPFGIKVNTWLSAADPARESFTGKEFDEEGPDKALGIRLYYFVARY